MDKARHALERALKLNPDYVPAIFHLGQLCDKLGEDESARKFFRRAMELDPSGEFGHRARERIEGFRPRVSFSLH
jgi:Tfp pilus assembly protein PilF